MKATDISRKQVKEIKKLYFEAFPKIERKPFWLMMLNNKRKKLNILYLEEDEKFIGLAVVADYSDKVLLLYFAINSEIRDKGYGSKALQLLLEKYSSKYFYLEIESTLEKCDDLNNRLRRKAFYIKNGLNVTNLVVNLYGTNMEVLSNGASIGYEEYIKPYEKNFGKGIRKKIYEIR